MSSSRRPGFSFVEIAAIVAIVGLLLSLSIGPVRSAFRLKTERAIQENIQSVWIGANAYFLANEATEVAVADLFKPDAGIAAVAQIKPVAGEDYTRVNGGTITATDRKLELAYGDAGKQRTVTYSVQ